MSMNKLTDIGYVRGLQKNLRVSLESPQGKETMIFLEEICGWYDFQAISTEPILIGHGKRQVLATIKTLLKYSPEQIVTLAKQKEEGNG